MTNRVKQYILHKCVLCSHYSGSSRLFDDYCDEDDNYCTCNDDNGEHINKRVIDLCDNNDSFENRF